MFGRLQNKWKVGGLQVVLILCTFAIGGSLTGYTGKKLMNTLQIEQGALWLVVYILVVTLLWPLAVLLVSVPLGQFLFFTNYLKKMGNRMGIRRQKAEVGGQKQEIRNQKSKVKSETQDSQQLATCLLDRQAGNQHPVHLAIFASGAGSNAQRIIDHFKNHGHIKISLIVCNKPGAGVLTIADKENIPSLLIEKEKFFRGDAYLDQLEEYTIDFIVLAGFLWKVPDLLIQAYPGKIVNIHPALLPKYGGKGMYGQHVHEAVIAAGEKESGITIHLVDGHYDNGDIIFQATCPVLENDDPSSLANRIHQLEHQHYPKVIEDIVVQQVPH
ncbi:phosphoribosylglycinamide formyltransferase [Terrimonas pollutisoli]|uniref:phosphoribosylglycinamide formyltransferase n=1 Tax=Terrimonas pollutisoli TaxID=3034147 RepID=UPI0023EAB53A|nr:phosphoribosylglycinamide formyltransferase [Terrimonas sp. H1YJ31]